MKVQLRDYQLECIDIICKVFKKTNRQLIQLPTGSGKTFIFLAYLSMHSNSSLILVPTKELQEQVEESSQHFMQKSDIFSRRKGKWKYAKHYITTAQSLNFDASYNYLIDKQFDTIVIDEAHKAMSNTYIKFIDEYSKKYPKTNIIGFTATPERSDRKSLMDMFHTLPYSKNILDMVNEGNLCDMMAFRIKTGQSFDSRKLNYGDFTPIALKSLDNETRNSLILKTFTDNCKDKKTLIFCVSVDQSVKIAKHMQDKGIACEAIHGSMPFNERRMILQRYKSGITQVLTNCQLLTEGFDEPSIEAIIIARPTKSKSLYCQMLGRGLRKFPKKEYCYLYELTDNAHKICTFNTTAELDDYDILDYRNGVKLSEVKNELLIHLGDSIETVIEKIYVMDRDEDYLDSINATHDQIACLESKGIAYFQPITFKEAAFLLWKEDLKRKYYGIN